MTTQQPDDTLIARLRERAADAQRRVDDRPFGESTLLPPATLEQVAVSERILGVTFPTLLRRLYTEVANGGFGPGPGILGLRSDNPGSGTKRGRTVEDLRAKLLNLSAENPGWLWSPILVPIADHYGAYVTVDCSTEAGRVVEFDFEELGGESTDGSWSSSFTERAGSLRAWLLEWLDGPAPPTRVTPG